MADNGFQTLRFTGGIAYDNWHTGSRAKRFEFLDEETVAIELISKVDDPALSPTCLKATAHLTDLGHFTTGYVQLTTLDGQAHPYGMSKFNFSIAHLDGEIVKIEGYWSDKDEPGVFPCTAILQREV